jgi:hypothetical protein
MRRPTVVAEFKQSTIMAGVSDVQDLPDWQIESLAHYVLSAPFFVSSARDPDFLALIANFAQALSPLARKPVCNHPNGHAEQHYREGGC